MPFGTAGGGSRSPASDELTQPSKVVLGIAFGLGLAFFLYLTVTGIESLGVGAAVPMAVSRLVGAGILLVALGTAVANAYLGGTIVASVSAPLAVALGYDLFLVVDDAFGFDAVVADLPTATLVVILPVWALFLGGVAHLAGRVLEWSVEAVTSRR